MQFANSELLLGGASPGPPGTHTGAVQFGGGWDVWFWGMRIEARAIFTPELPTRTSIPGEAVSMIIVLVSEWRAASS